jgi:hypothetical protein
MVDDDHRAAVVLGQRVERGLYIAYWLFQRLTERVQEAALAYVPLTITRAVAGLLGLQRTPQRLDGSRPLASCHQRRNRLHQPHRAEEITLRDVMNDRPVQVRFEEVLRSRLHQVGAEPPQSLAEPDPRQRLVVGYLTAEGAHPRGIRVRGSCAQRTVGGLGGPAEQARTVHPFSVTIEVRQSREHLVDGSVDGCPRLVSNRSSSRLFHAITSLRIVWSPRARGSHGPVIELELELNPNDCCSVGCEGRLRHGPQVTFGQLPATLRRCPDRQISQPEQKHDRSFSWA